MESPKRTLQIRKCLLNTNVRVCVRPSESGLSGYFATSQAEVDPQGTGVGLLSKGTPVHNYSNPLIYARCAGKIIYRSFEFEFDEEKEVGGSLASCATTEEPEEKTRAGVFFRRRRMERHLPVYERPV